MFHGKKVWRVFAAIILAISVGAGTMATVAGQDTGAGNDTATGDAGDITIGNSSTGDSTAENTSNQGNGNGTGQNVDQDAGNQANAPVTSIDQSSGNTSTAGDGGDGGDAGNEGDVDAASQIVAVLVRILQSILSGDDTIIEVDEDEDPVIVEFDLVDDCEPAVGKVLTELACIAETGEVVTCDFGSLDGDLPLLVNCMLDGEATDCTFTSDGNTFTIACIVPGTD